MIDVSPCSPLVSALEARLAPMFADPALAWIAALAAAEAVLDAPEFDAVLGSDLASLQLQILRGAVVDSERLGLIRALCQ